MIKQRRQFLEGSNARKKVSRNDFDRWRDAKEGVRGILTVWNVLLLGVPVDNHDSSTHFSSKQTRSLELITFTGGSHILQLFCHKREPIYKHYHVSGISIIQYRDLKNGFYGDIVALRPCCSWAWVDNPGRMMDFKIIIKVLNGIADGKTEAR